MVVFPNAKINLGLNVTEKLSNGYHSLESVFYPVPWTDILEIIPASETTFTGSGIEINCAPEENLTLRIFRELQKRFTLPEIKMHLHKAIPAGAGLGAVLLMGLLL